jgi:hypothetical protein
VKPKTKPAPLNGPIRFYAAIFRSTLGAPLKSVLGALYLLADWKTGGSIRATAKTIGDLAGVSQRSARKHLAALEEMRLVLVSGGVRGGWTPSGAAIVPVRAIDLAALEGLDPANAAAFPQPNPANPAGEPGTIFRTTRPKTTKDPAELAANQNPLQNPSTTTFKTPGVQDPEVVVVVVGSSGQKERHSDGRERA